VRDKDKKKHPQDLWDDPRDVARDFSNWRSEKRKVLPEPHERDKLSRANANAKAPASSTTDSKAKSTEVRRRLFIFGVYPYLNK